MQIHIIERIIEKLEKGELLKEEFRNILPYCLEISNKKALFKNRNYEVITEDNYELKNYNINIESDYYKNSDNFNSDFKFNVNSNDDTHYLHYGHMSILSKKSNLDLYIKNLKFLIFKIKNNEEIHNNKSFYIDESLEKKFIDTGKKF
ncbi:hypothetical protein [Aliarcobacter butzleri]|uniref:hypothetical protein n=1 Tax=Aliarcobacter butzleri TaxID=28197 RepID=UPI001EDA2606|nr:hypothetical protein [Aliarcobacter butzleri]MCG3691100.1 hypothetical protein [Aliarcobacter butzleri]